MKKLTSEQLDKLYLELNVGNLDIAGLIRALCVYGNGEVWMDLTLWESLKWVLTTTVYESNIGYKAGNVETFFVLRLDEYKTLIKCCIEKVETSGKVIGDYTLKIKIR